MKVIAVTGGVGSGKSSVCHYMEKNHNAYLLLADDVGRDVCEPGGRCYDELVSLLGREYFDDNGLMDRKAVGDMAFADPSILTRMNALIHPAVKDEIAGRIERYESEGGKLAVIEAALLFEGGLDTLADETWYVYVDRDIRIERLLASRPLTLEKAENIMSRQKPDEFFFTNCTRVIDNSGDFTKTAEAVDKALAAPDDSGDGHIGQV